MKQLVISALLLVTILSISCAPVKNTQADTSNPSTIVYTSERILEIARKFSPDCRLKKALEWKSG